MEVNSKEIKTKMNLLDSLESHLIKNGVAFLSQREIRNYTV
jgi:hypothetical protein